MDDKQLPRSEESERLVLGTLMREKNALSEVQDILTEDSFYFDKHKEIYRAIQKVAERGDVPEMMTVFDELQKKDSGITPYEFTSIFGEYTPYIYQHAAIIHDKHKRRKFFEIGCYLQQNSYSEDLDILDVLEEAKEKLGNLFSSGIEEVSTIQEAVRGVYDNIGKNMAGTSQLTGFPTGFKEFDNRSGGLQTSDLIIIAADTSAGKTSLAIKIAMNTGCPIAFYSMEMKKEQIAARMISIESGVPANEILFSKLGESQISAIDKGVSRVLQKPVYFDDRSTSNIDNILASIRRMKIKYGIKGAIVDYLQILNVNMKGTNKEQQMGEVARRLKNLAKEIDIWIIALSQLNRDSLNPVPSLARLRDSGQIAEASDVVMLIYRPEIYGKAYPDPYQHSSTLNTAMIDVAKGRNIGLLKFIVGFNKPTTNFYELSQVPVMEEENAPF